MIFETRLAVRYLNSSKFQTLLLCFGVAVGVLVFTFMAALMNGLGVRLVNDVTGSASHVTLEPTQRPPSLFATSQQKYDLGVVQPPSDRTKKIDSPKEKLRAIRSFEEVEDAIVEISGAALLARGERSVSVEVRGVETESADTILPLSESLVDGELRLGVSDVLIGKRLAQELSLKTQDRLTILVSAGAGKKEVRRVFLVRGIFELGIKSVDERVCFLNYEVAQRMFGLGNGASSIKTKLRDVWTARELDPKLASATSLSSSNWIDENEQLQNGLRAQQTTASLIKGFCLLIVAIGVASALFLSVSRKKSEIGIIRSFGISRAVIVRAFLIQGLLIGLFGSLLGLGLGYGFNHLILKLASGPEATTTIPIDPAQGEYWIAVATSVLMSGVAAVLPARSAASIDPLEAIQS